MIDTKEQSSVTDISGQVEQVLGGNPYYDEDGITIYNADCMDILPQLGENEIDLIVTDPPYKDEDVNGQYYDWIANYFDMVKNKCEYLIMFNNSSRCYKLMQRLGEPYRIMVWTKGVIKYAWRWEPIFIYQFVKDFKINKHIWSDHLPCQPLYKVQSLHPYEKPIKLMKNIIKYIPDDKIICDTFAGSGTTLKAAKELGRKAIGIEISERYCEIAARRLGQMELQLETTG